MKELLRFISIIKLNLMLSKAKNNITREYILKMINVENKQLTKWKPIYK